MTSTLQVPLLTVGLPVFDGSLNEEEAGIQSVSLRFAKDVMRPLGQEIDRVPAEQSYPPGIRFGNAASKCRSWHRTRRDGGNVPRPSARVEEMFWGDTGLGVSTGAEPANGRRVVQHVRRSMLWQS